MKSLRFAIYDLRLERGIDAASPLPAIKALFLQSGLKSALLAAGLLLVSGISTATPFYFQGYKSDGTPQTNLVYQSIYPASTSPFVIYGTNIIYGANVIVSQPNSNGYFSNWCYPGTYRFYITNLNVSFVASIPDATNMQSLALYTTNQPAFSGVGLNSAGLMTTLLGFAPATNSNSGIVFALGYTPATNTFNGITNSLGFWPATNTIVGISAALGYVPATNTYPGISNLLAFVPTTNTPAGITNALNYMPATNNNAGVVSALGFAPATNNNPGIVAALGFAPVVDSTAGIVSALGYTPPTNTYSGLTNALGFAPATNSTSGIESALGFTPANATFSGISVALGYTPRTNDGYTGLPALSGAANIVTNGFIAWVSYKTNSLPGAVFTNLPNGSLMSTTNGQLFVLSNLVWNVMQ